MGGLPKGRGRNSGYRFRSLVNARRNRRRRYNYPDLREETKFLDIGRSETALQEATDAAGLEVMPSAGCTNCISCPAVGDSASNRDGNKFIIKSIQVKGFIRLQRYAPTGARTAPNVVNGWIAMVLDTQTNGTAVNSEDVFKQIVADEDMLPFRNLNYAGKRFRILRFFKWSFGNRNFALSNDGTANTYIAEQMIRFKMFKKLNILVNCYSQATTADVASVTDNSVSIIAATNYADDVPVIAYSARMRFRG